MRRTEGGRQKPLPAVLPPPLGHLGQHFPTKKKKQKKQRGAELVPALGLQAAMTTRLRGSRVNRQPRGHFDCYTSSTSRSAALCGCRRASAQRHQGPHAGRHCGGKAGPPPTVSRPEARVLPASTPRRGKGSRGRRKGRAARKRGRS